MRSIQEVGTEILTNSPAKFYIFVGEEYGIKQKYLSVLSKYYNDRVYTYAHVQDVLDFMQTKHLIPLQPALYIVRYDEEFISSIKDGIQLKIDNTRIIGTMVCIYDQPKHANKLDKYLDKYVVSIDPISSKFMFKYLKSDFKHLSDNLIQTAIKISTDYSQAYNICLCMNSIDSSELHQMSDRDLTSLFGYQHESTELQFKLGFAAKDLIFCLNLLNTYTGDYDLLLYSLLSTMVELDKLHYNKYSESAFRQYSSLWTDSDIYNMFNHIYYMIKRMRSGDSINIVDGIVYILSLLSFQPIPSMEVLN